MNAFVPLENPESVVSFLSQIPLFGGIAEVHQNEIFSRMEAGNLRRGEVVFQEGDDPTHIYIVKSGLIGLFISNREVKIEKKRLGKGEGFGHVAMMSGNKHSISAVAVVDSEIIVLPKKLLQRMHEEDLELYALLMTNMARELARRVQFTDDLLLKSMHTQEQRTQMGKITGP